MAVLWLMLNDRDCLKAESGSRGEGADVLRENEGLNLRLSTISFN